MIPLFKVAMSLNAGLQVKDVLNSGYIGQGAQVDFFEEKLRDTLGAEVKPVTTNSCTAALDLALHMCGVGPGDVVISTPITCLATNMVIKNRGAKIAWVDVDPVTGNIDPDSVAELLGKWHVHPKAIMAVDWAGRACEYDWLRAVAQGVPIIEDAAHAFGTTYNTKPIAVAGGDYVCWSFQAIKHLTTGDGGALKTPQGQDHRARLLRWFGLDRTTSASMRCAQVVPESGYKYHMNDIAAAIGLANMQLAQANLAMHRDNAAFYHEALKGAPGITLPPPDSGSSWWLYTILVNAGEKARDALITHLDKECGIEASLVHARNDTQVVFNRNSLNLRGVNDFASSEVCIPVGWWLTNQERQHIVDSVQEWAHVTTK